MPEHPIIFSGEMVRAILDGSKTQTRRVIATTRRLQHLGFGILPNPSSGKLIYYDGGAWNGDNAYLQPIASCPYGKPGDTLWVRETWGFNFFKRNGSSPPEYKADWYGDEPPSSIKWKPSIHMPRKYSRITLEVVKVRVERVQEISPADMEAEGMRWLAETTGNPFGSVFDTWRNTWDFINAKRGYGWNENPWIWAIEFKRVNP